MVSIPFHIPRIGTDEQALVNIKPGQRGRISLIEDEEMKLALLQMGISEGDEVTHMGMAPFRDPISIMVNRTKVCIRKRDAARIWITVK